MKPMETENFYDLQPNPKNPRKISEQEFEALKRSIQTFGDLSAIIRNQRTGHLVGGHMRRNAFEKMGGEKRVVITHRFDAPNRQGTVAIGYVEYDGEMFNYRVVDWDEGTEASAAIAANNISGDWDKDLLAQLDYELSQLENGDELLALSGQSEDEITKLLQSVGALPEPEEPEEEPDEPKDDGKVTFALSPDHKEIVDRALAQAKADYAIPHTNLDDINGTALYYISQYYLQNHASQNIETPAEPELPADQSLPAASTNTPLDELPAGA